MGFGFDLNQVVTIATQLLVSDIIVQEVKYHTTDQMHENGIAHIVSKSIGM